MNPGGVGGRPAKGDALGFEGNRRRCSNLLPLKPRRRAARLGPPPDSARGAVAFTDTIERIR